MRRKQTRLLSLFVAMFIVVINTFGAYVMEVNAATEKQNNIVARADYLYDAIWVCKKTVAGWRGNYYFYEGETYHIPYGQPVSSGKYIGFTASVDTFLNSTKDAGSVFYTTRSNYDGKKSVYYAMDCSAFVSWCWGASRHTTLSIHNISTKIGNVTAANMSKIQLGDALNSTSVRHVVLVTDLIYDSNGVLVKIEITEMTPPQLLRSYYTPEELVAKYGGSYKIYRYNGNTPEAPTHKVNPETVVTTVETTTVAPETTTPVMVETTLPDGTAQEGIVPEETVPSMEDVTTSADGLEGETTFAVEGETSEQETTTVEIVTTEAPTTTKAPETTETPTTTKAPKPTTTPAPTAKKPKPTTTKAPETTTIEETTTEEETTTIEETTTEETSIEETTTYYYEEETTTDMDIIVGTSQSGTGSNMKPPLVATKPGWDMNILAQVTEDTDVAGYDEMKSVDGMVEGYVVKFEVTLNRRNIWNIFE